MTEFTRLVVVGSGKRATLVIPSNEAVSTHLGAIVKLVREPDPEGDLLTLVHPTGEHVRLAESLTDQGVLDGTVLHLVRSRDVPPEPEVSDVSDLITQEFGTRTTPKTVAHRRIAATLATAIGAFFIGVAVIAIAPGWPARAIWLTATVVAIAFALLGWRVATRLAVAAGIGVGVADVLSLMLLPTARPALGALDSDVLFSGTGTVWILLLMGSLTTGVVFGVAERSIAPAAGSAVGALVSLVGLATLSITSDASRAGSIAAVAALAVLALLPTLSLTLSGLTRLDDIRNDTSSSEKVKRPQALMSIARSYENFQWITVATALGLVIALPSLLRSVNGWFVALGIIIALITLLRARLAPLALSSWALYLAAILGLAIGAPVMQGDPLQPTWLGTHQEVFIAGVVIAIALAVIVALATPTLHAAARMRRFGDLAESMLALSVVPVVLGGFGVYSTLLGVF